MTMPTIVGVYRAANAATVERLVTPALAAGWTTAWWALDSVAPSLARHTVGEGPGEKLPLLNETLGRHGSPAGAVVFSDDDIIFTRGDVTELVSLATRAGLGLAQPAHAPGSEVSHGITRAFPRSRVRLTTFVESGPLVVVAPEWVERVLPLPDWRGMGWGIELDWMDFQRDGCLLGVVDAFPVRHLTKVAVTYDDTELRARLRSELASRGAGDWAPLQWTLGVWRPWQRRPPWEAGANGRGARHDRRAARRRVDTRRTLLVNHWYSHAVGHVIEALRVCQGYHAADPTLRISLVLNGASPVEIAGCVPFLENVYGAQFTSFGTVEGDPARALREIPRDWDHVVHHDASVDPGQIRFEGVQRYYAASRARLRGRLSQSVASEGRIPYLPNQTLRLTLPERARESAARELGAGRRSIALMPAGSSTLRALYPSLTSWLEILDELSRRVPDARFSLIGRYTSVDGRTSSGIGRDEIERIVASRDAIDWFDRPILEQLAAVEASSLFVSPHTGFGFAAVAVGTPWLTLSGGDWFEYFFNGVPFYSLLPKDPDYPPFAFGQPLPMIEADEDGEGPRTASMSIGRIRGDLEELGDAARLLVDGSLSFDEALDGYLQALVGALDGDVSRIATFDNVHVGRI
jgi:hypothetical protein